MDKSQTDLDDSQLEGVRQRVYTTREEVGTIIADIDKMIQDGIGLLKSPALLKKQPQSDENSRNNTNKEDVNIEKDCPNKAKNNCVTNAHQKVPVKQQQQSPQPTKSKPYNVAETREYIKKQREKRAQELRTQTATTDNRIDLRKQKLKELQIKSRELLAKNVQMKRERSKSRDRNDEVRIDRAKFSSTNRDRSKSRERPKCDQQQQQHNDRNNKLCNERIKPSATLQQNRDRSKSRERPKRDQQQKDHNNKLCIERIKPSETLQQNRDRSKSRERPICDHQQEQQNKEAVGSISSRPSRSTIKKTDLNRPERNITIRKRTDNKNDNNSGIETIDVVNDRRVVGNAIIIDNCEKVAKETQTSQKLNNSPLLLIPPQHQQIPTNPYNFINTVKRKLQYVVNGGRESTDIGIQNTLSIDNRQKLTNEIHELLVKNSEKIDADDEEVKSFMSHHQQEQHQSNLNLNLESVEKLKLIPSIRNRNVPKRLFEDSGSDTSKNIPEISSESGVSSSRSTVINSEANLDLERLQNLKLHTFNCNENSEIITKSTKSYSSDFIDEIKSKTTTSSGRIEEQITNNNNNDNQSEISTVLNKSFYIKESNDTFENNHGTIDESLALKVPPLNLNINRTRGDGADIYSNTPQRNPTYSINASISTTQNSSKIPENLPEKNSVQSKIITNNQPKNITIKTNLNDTNSIHLKFEAEVHLLDDFNKSFHRFLELEEAFQHLKLDRNERTSMKSMKILQNNDAQTSFKTATTTTTTQDQELSINFSRGSEYIDGNLSVNSKAITIPELELDSFNTTNNEQLTINQRESPIKSLIGSDYDVNNCAGLSVNMFEQLIKDEDARLNHLKAIIKIREQALLDRTKGELVWLEIQKKQLVETGKVEQASLIKKKQRAILLKLEQERNEIKRLKQTQKQASNERINKLKHQRNLIKSQLSTNEMLTNIKITTPSTSTVTRKNRRHSGPLIVTQNRKEAIQSETTISTRKSWSGDDCLSIRTTSKISRRSSSTVEYDSDNSVNFQQPQQAKSTSSLHRNLSMREKALRERKKTAEELLKWHQKLLEEEKKITALEIAANVLVKQIPKNKKKKRNHLIIGGGGGKQQQQQQQQDIFEFNGKQLNQLWRNMTGRIEKKFIDDKDYIMSQSELEKFCKSAAKTSSITTQQKPKNKSSELKTLNCSITTTTSELSDARDIPNIAGKTSDDQDNDKENGEYSSEFESESVHEIITNIDEDNDDNNEIDPNQITSISELIHNFTQIEDEISGFGKIQEKFDESNRTEDCISIEQLQQSNEITEDTTNQQNIVTEENDSNSTKIDEIIDENVIKSAEISENVVNSITDHILKTEDSIKKIDEQFDQSLKILSTTDIPQTNLENSVTMNSDEVSKTNTLQTDKNQTNLNSEHLEPTPITSIIEDTNNNDNNSIIEIADDKSSKIEDNSTTLQDIVSTEILSEKLEKHDESIEESQMTTIKESEQYSDDFKSESVILENSKSQVENCDENSQISDDTKTSPTKSSTNQQIDVKKRVSQIMADTSTLRSDKSPRLQDIYITTYDNELLGASDDVKHEAEELFRKQIAIEQEIKQLEQQQKEVIPYVYMREIPNKPPPPYTPPSTLPIVQTILPVDPKEIDEITNYTSKVLYKAYELNNLDNVKFSENSFKLISKLDINKNCCELLFNICKELANEHYQQFKMIKNEPIWMNTLNKKQQLSLIKPYDCRSLQRYMNRKLKELFGFEKPQIQESMIIKWGRKKRDHVDEILIKESQEEDAQWTNFDKDELIIKDQFTDLIMSMLIDETVDIVKRIASKRNPITCLELKELDS